MTCPKCNGEVWDNRTKKANGEMKPNAPDFSCKDKAVCKWVQWPPKKGASVVAAPQLAPMPVTAPQPGPVGPSPRDTLLIELYWDSFDRILEGVAKRKLTDLFKPEHLMAATSTLYIQR